MGSATYRPESPGSEVRRDAVFGRALLEINGSPRRLRFEQWAEVLEVGLLATVIESPRLTDSIERPGCEVDVLGRDGRSRHRTRTEVVPRLRRRTDARQRPGRRRSWPSNALTRTFSGGAGFELATFGL
jgi:hypothetical protein